MKKRVKSAISLFVALFLVLSIIPLSTIHAKADGVDDFIGRCYKVTLGRDADSDGYAYWRDILVNRKQDGSVVAHGFLFSPEYINKQTPPEQYVKDLYMLFMGREPEQSGYDYWCEKMTNGESREQIFAGFANSKEYFDLCYGYGITAGYYSADYGIQQVNGVNLFVERMYQTSLDRLGDQGGQNDWVQALLEGRLTGVECARCFVQSPEFINKDLSNEDYLKSLYRAFMGREYDQGGLDYWLDNMSNGMTRDEVFEGFAMSPEFEAICANYGINRGTYKATDVSKPQEPQNPDQPAKRFRAVKRLFSCGDYSLITYEYPDAVYNVTEKRFDKDGNFKGYAEVYEHNADYTEQKSGYTSFDDEGNDTYKSFYKWVYNSDWSHETEYYYSDEWNTLESYSEEDLEKYTITENGESYVGYVTKKSTSFNPNGEMIGYTLYEHDSKHRITSQKDYSADGKPNYFYDFEYYYKSDDEYKDRKKQVYTYFTDGVETWKSIDEYNENGKLLKTTSYSSGELNGYTLYEYDSKGNRTKSVYWYLNNGEEAIGSWRIYEYNSKGNLVKETGYNSDNTVYSINTYEYNNDLLTKETSWQQYNDVTNETAYKYDQYGNKVKIIRKENGVEKYWEEIQYAEY